MTQSNQQRHPLAGSALTKVALGAAAFCSIALSGCSTEPNQDDRVADIAVDPVPLDAPATASEAAPTDPSFTSPESEEVGEAALVDHAESPAASTPDNRAAPNLPTDPMTAPDPAPTDAPQLEVATLGAGCFWCIEAVLEQVDGVESVVSGYMGGQTLNPTYKDICTGTTGHAEVVKVTFDPKVLPYTDLLDWFWRSHDPTTLNRQGADRGTQYRSAIFTHSEAQLSQATTSKADVAPSFSDPIVTEITPASTFYPAEAYHQGYYFGNASQGYCRAVIAPKLKKLGLKY